MTDDERPVNDDDEKRKIDEALAAMEEQERQLEKQEWKRKMQEWERRGLEREQQRWAGWETEMTKSVEDSPFGPFEIRHYVHRKTYRLSEFMPKTDEPEGGQKKEQPHE